MRAAWGEAAARAALAGNPSDGFGGAVLAVTLAGWSARVDVAPARRDVVDPAAAAPLVRAALARWRRRRGRDEPVAAVVRTGIPRQAGLAGSSAIVVATLRALGAACEAPLGPGALAHEALAAEVDELGLAAGPQDRVVQSHGGLLLMDFADGWRHERLPVERLPPLLVAHRRRPSRPSTATHRLLGGDHEALAPLMGRLADTARRAAGALEKGDHATFGACLDASLDLRREAMPLDRAEEAGVLLARGHGAAANYAGSGGAVVATVPDDEAGLIAAWRAAGWAARRLQPRPG